jgi:hypothetical protein
MNTRTLAAASVDDALAEIGKGRPSYKGLSLRRCLEVRPDYREFLHWCMNWCVSRRKYGSRLSRNDLQAAWQAADEFDASINLTSLYSMGIVSVAKLNDAMHGSAVRSPPRRRRDGGAAAGAATSRRGGGSRRGAAVSAAGSPLSSDAESDGPDPAQLLDRQPSPPTARRGRGLQMARPPSAVGRHLQ